jgi:hypothetical protein
MDLSKDIAGDPEPEAESPSPASESRPLRGHHAKIAEVEAELLAEGKLPPNLRPCHRDKIILERLDAKGYGKDRPSPRALRRYFNWA